MKGEKRALAKILVVFVGLILLIAAAHLAWRYFTAEVTGRVNAEVQIESAESRIQRYEQFFDMCSTVVEKKASLKAQKRLAKVTTDEEDLSRIYTNIAALESQVAGDVMRYNNEARKSYTSGRFFDDRLPEKLKVEGETHCAN